jgi:N-acetylglutamate synthase-like GNAT family acetyltransferase
MEKGKNEGMLKERSDADIRRDMHRGNCFLYEKEGLVVGMVFLVVYDKRLAEMRSVYVDDGQRRNGAGPALVRSALARGKELGIESVMIITKKENAAWFGQQGFCNEAHGFRVAMFAKTEA